MILTEESYSTFPHTAYPIRDKINVSTLYTVHFFSNEPSYDIPGEIHPFWEIIYIDSGAMEVTVEGISHLLSQGTLYVLRPNCFHCMKSVENTLYSMFIISFDCASPLLELTQQQCFFRCNSRIKNCISNIVREAQTAFLYPLDRISMQQMQLQKKAPYGTLLVIKLYLEVLLVELRREYDHSRFRSIDDNASSILFSEPVVSAISYMNHHLTDRCTLDELCRAVGMSRSQLQKRFVRETGKSLMSYFRALRITAAKYWIRKKKKSFAEVAELYQFSSVHHFSNCFKQLEGQTPTQYVTSLQAIMDGYTDAPKLLNDSVETPPV